MSGTIFNKQDRLSNSPVPLRSPTPDYSNKSGIIQTQALKYSDSIRKTKKLPLEEQVKFLRQENVKLKKTIENKGHLLNNDIHQLIKEKDRTINDLKNQLKSKQIRLSKGLQLISNSIQKHSIFNPQQEKNIIEQNSLLSSKIKELINQNQELKKKKSLINNSSLSQKAKQIQKDQPLPYLNSEQITTKINLQMLKNQLGKEITQSFNIIINQLSNNINTRLHNIDKRVHSIQNKIFLRQTTKSSVQKPREITTIDNFSPIALSNVNTNTRYQISSFTHQQEPRRTNLNNKIQLQQQISIKDETIKALRQNMNSNHELIFMKQTLIQLRHSYSNLLQQLQFQKQQNQRLKTGFREVNKQNSNLINSDSQSQILKLRQKVLQLQKHDYQNVQICKHLQNTHKQLTFTLKSLNQLKNKHFQLSIQNMNLMKQLNKNTNLQGQIQILKARIFNFENTKQQILKDSTHTNNQLMRLNNQIQSLLTQIDSYKSQIKAKQNEDFITQDKLNRFIIQRQQTNTILQSIRQQNTHLKHQLEFLNLTNNSLQSQITISKNQNQHLLQQINSLRKKLTNSQEYLSKSQNNQNIKNNQLIRALRELSEVKKILQAIDFNPIQDIAKQLQHKERQKLEQSQQITRYKKQFKESINKLLIENQILRKQSFTFTQKLIEQKQQIEHLYASINCLNDENTNLKLRINKLEEVIHEYVSSQTHHTIIRSDEKQVQSHYYVDSSNHQNYMQQINKLQQPINIAVNKLDFISEKIESHVKSNQYQHHFANDVIQKVKITEIK